MAIRKLNPIKSEYTPSSILSMFEPMEKGLFLEARLEMKMKCTAGLKLLEQTI